MKKLIRDWTSKVYKILDIYRFNHPVKSLDQEGGPVMPLAMAVKSLNASVANQSKQKM